MSEKEMRECIEGWKKWHSEIRAVLGLQINERTVTLDEIKQLKFRLKAYDELSDYVLRAAGRK